MMENGNCDKSVCSVDRESMLVEHDYCRSGITCDIVDKKDDHALVEKSTSYGVETQTDGQYELVQVRNVDDWNEIIARGIAVQELHCPFLPNKQIRGKVCKNLEIPAVMGDFFSRASKKLDEQTPDSLSKARKKISTRTASPAMAAKREKQAEITSREGSVFESGASSYYSRQNVTEDSGMISHGSELSESITPDFELLRDASMQSWPAEYLTPVCSGPSACGQAIAPVEERDASIHSQPTQILAGVCELPNFRQAFGSLAPNNFSNCSSPPPTSTPNYQLSDSQRTVCIDASEARETVVEENSNDCLPSSLTPNCSFLDSQRTVFAGTSDTGEGVVESGTLHENSSNCSSPSLTPNYTFSSSGRTEFSEISFSSDGDLELGSPNEYEKCDSPEVFSAEDYSSSDRQEAVFTDKSDGKESVIDLEPQNENSNSASPELFSDENYPPSDSQETALADTSDTRVAKIDIEPQNENSTSASPELFSNENYPPSDNQKTILIDVESQNETFNSSSPELFSNENYSPSDGEKTAVTDTSVTHVAVIDLEPQNENSNSGSPASTAITDASDDDSALTQCLRRSPSPDTTSSNTPEEFIDPESQYCNSNYNDSEVAQSPTNTLQLMDRQRVIDGEIRREYSNDYKIVRSASTASNLSDFHRAIDREIAFETSNGSKTIGSTASKTNFPDTYCSVDNHDLPTQICTPTTTFCHDGSENRITINEQTPDSFRERKRKREEEPESLWTVVDFSESESLELKIMKSLSRLSTVGNADPLAISVGTKLSTPEFLKTLAQNHINVSLDHSYSEPTTNSSAVRELQLEDFKSGSCPSAAYSEAGKTGKIRTLKKFSGSDSSNVRNFDLERVKKINKRKIDFDDCKENWPLKKRHLRNSPTPQRSTFDSNKILDSRSRRLNLNYPREDHCTELLDFSKYLSNRCCEYDHTFPNLTSFEYSPYEPILLRHLVETSYEEIKLNIDELVRCFEVSGEDF